MRELLNKGVNKSDSMRWFCVSGLLCERVFV